MILALAAPAHAGTLAFGPHGGICLDCKSDQMHWLGGGVEAERQISPAIALGGELAIDSLTLTSDECQFERTGQRVIAAGRVRVSSQNTPGFFVALAAGAVAVRQKTTCPRSAYDMFFGWVIRPQLGWDIELAPHRWLRLEIASDLEWESDFNGAPAVEIEGGALFAFSI